MKRKDVNFIRNETTVFLLNKNILFGCVGYSEHTEPIEEMKNKNENENEQKIASVYVIKSLTFPFAKCLRSSCKSYTIRI